MQSSRRAPGVAGRLAIVRAMMWCLALPAGCGGDDAEPVAPDPSQPTCPSNWGTGAFFSTATPALVAACAEAGRNMNRRDLDGRTPLHVAVRNTDDPEVIRALIGAGAQPSGRNNEDHTVLCVAVVYNEHPEVIQALLDGDAHAHEECRDARDPDGVYPPGVSPLHLAAAHNANPSVAEVLVRAGADLNAQPGLGGTPLMFAAGTQSNPAMLELLIRAGADMTGAMESAAENERPAIIRVLIEAGAGVSGALHRSVFNRNTEIAEILIDAGADVNEKHPWDAMEGSTPLIWAARFASRANLAAMEALLEAGADPNIQDVNGMTALDWARTPPGHAEMVELLRRYGAS